MGESLFLFAMVLTNCAGGCVKTPNINNKKLVVRSCVDVQRVFVFLQKKNLINNLYGVIWVK